MEVPRNAFKRALAEGRRPIGFWLSLGSPAVPSVIEQLRALEGGTAAAIVRPAWNDPVLVKRLLDAGAQSLLGTFAPVEDDARRYLEMGVRGAAGGADAVVLRQGADDVLRSFRGIPTAPGA